MCPPAAKNDDFDLSDTGLLPQYLAGPIGVQEVQPGTPAEQAGLRAGDAIQSVDGHAFHTVDTLLAYMQAGQGKPITLTVLRNGATRAPWWLIPPSSIHGLEAGLRPRAHSHSRQPAAPDGGH